MNQALVKIYHLLFANYTITSCGYVDEKYWVRLASPEFQTGYRIDLSTNRAFMEIDDPSY